VDIIECDNAIEIAQPKTSLGFKKAGMPAQTVFGEFEKEFLFMASMRDVPHLPGKMVAVCSRHF